MAASEEADIIQNSSTSHNVLSCTLSACVGLVASGAAPADCVTHGNVKEAFPKLQSSVCPVESEG
jgi:hypothetical protein